MAKATWSMRHKGAMMVGKNTLIISEKEMLRAVNLYFKELITFNARDDSIVKSVRQKGAMKGRPFILEIDDRIVKKTNPRGPVAQFG